MATQRINPKQQNNSMSSQTNSGTAGGTMKYVNLGGVKILTLNVSVATQNTYTVIYPTGLFSSTPSIALGPTGSAGTTNGMYIVLGTADANGFSFYSGFNAQAPTNLIVIGT